jgi:hypothetical protein
MLLKLFPLLKIFSKPYVYRCISSREPKHGQVLDHIPKVVIHHKTIILFTDTNEPIRPGCPGPNVAELEVVPLPVTAKHRHLPLWATVTRDILAIKYKAV